MFRDEDAPHDIVCVQCGSPTQVDAASDTKCRECTEFDPWLGDDGELLSFEAAFGQDIRPLLDELSRRSIKWSLAPYGTDRNPDGVILHFDDVEVTTSLPYWENLVALVSTPTSWLIGTIPRESDTSIVTSANGRVLVAPFVSWLVDLARFDPDQVSINGLDVSGGAVNEQTLTVYRDGLPDDESYRVSWSDEFQIISDISDWILSREEFDSNYFDNMKSGQSKYAAETIDRLISKLNDMLAVKNRATK